MVTTRQDVDDVGADVVARVPELRARVAESDHEKVDRRARTFGAFTAAAEHLSDRDAAAVGAGRAIRSRPKPRRHRRLRRPALALGTLGLGGFGRFLVESPRGTDTWATRSSGSFVISTPAGTVMSRT